MRFGICCSLKTCGKTQVRQRYSEESMSQRKLIRMGPQKQSRWVGKQQQQQLKWLDVVLWLPGNQTLVTRFPRWWHTQHSGIGCVMDGPHSCPGLRCCPWGRALWTPGGREAHLRTVLDVVSFVEAKVTQVVGRRPFAGSARLRGQGQVGEMVRQGAQAFYDVVKGPVRWRALKQIVVQCLMEKKKRHTKIQPGTERYVIFACKCMHLILYLILHLILTPAHRRFTREANTHVWRQYWEQRNMFFS